ncbi:MAG: alpha/beta fold hydrolase [Chitinophagales bacterium]
MRLNYKSFGKGEPLIILHGLLGSLDNWQSIARKLSDDYKVYIVDQRNHGKSPHSEEHTFESMQQDLLELMDSEEIEKANILGHSMGGKTAMLFAIKNPDRVNKLIVVDIANKAYGRGHDDIFKALMAVPIDEIESRNEAEEVLAKYIPQKAIRLFLIKNLDRLGSSDNFTWKMNLDALWENYDRISEVLPNGVFEGNVLFLKGEHSPYIQKADEALIKKQFPKAVIKTVPNAGHWVHAESPKEFLKILKAFLES